MGTSIMEKLIKRLQKVVNLAHRHEERHQNDVIDFNNFFLQASVV